MSSQNPKVSIIIPVYNVERYLCKCIDSAISQTLKEIEILLIYDNSSDNSLSVCHAYAEKYRNVFLYLGLGLGAGAARNLGVENAIGDYICYLDSDDWVDPNLCEEMYGFMEDTKADFINFGLEFITQTETIIRRKANFKSHFLVGSTIFIKSMLDDDILTVVWNKCYRRSFLLEHDIRFPEVTEWEDILYTRKIAYFSDKTYFINKIYYHALVRDDSRSRSISPDFLIKGLELLKIEHSFIISIDNLNIYNDLFRAHYLKHLTFFLVKAAFEIKSYSEYLSCFRVIMNSDYYNIVFYKQAKKYLSFRIKLAILLCNYPKLLRMSALFLKKINIRTY